MTAYASVAVATPDAVVVRDTALNYWDWLDWLDRSVAAVKSAVADGAPAPAASHPATAMLNLQTLFNGRAGPSTTALVRDGYSHMLESALTILEDDTLPPVFTQEAARAAVDWWASQVRTMDTLKKQFDAAGGVASIKGATATATQTPAIAVAVQSAITGQPAMTPAQAAAENASSGKSLALLGAGVVLILVLVSGRGKKRG